MILFTCRERELRKNKEERNKYYQSLRPKPDSLLAQLHSLTLDDITSAARKRLENICEEQDFSSTFVPLEELGKNGQHICLVQLSTVPAAVCHGMGDSEDEAAEKAALAALEFLLVMTK